MFGLNNNLIFAREKENPDWQEVILCKDCYYLQEEEKRCLCKRYNMITGKFRTCKGATKKEEENE